MDDVRVEHIWKSYGAKIILRDVSFHVKPNTILCLMSPSGSGKTTLLRLVTGLETPDRGRILVPDGFRWGVLFQENRLLERLDAFGNLRFALGESLRGREMEVHTLLNAVGLGDVGDKRTGDFSGGMKRRLALVRALLCRCDGLALDEPFTGLDTENRQRCLELIRRYAAHKTVLCVTHDPADAAALRADTFTLPDNTQHPSPDNTQHPSPHDAQRPVH